jgi:hypothetical protein
VPTARRLFALLAVLAAVGLGAGCGSNDTPQPQGAAPAAGSPTRNCDQQPPGHAADGVNDEQGGSRPGTDPCAGE